MRTHLVRIVAVVVPVLAAGCGGGVPPEPPPETAPAETAAGVETRADVYVVRGRIEELPDVERPGSRLRIHHEAIDDFKGHDGEIWGMDSMTMSFEVAGDSDLDGLSVGDTVEFKLEVQWAEPSPPMVAEIRKLPQETVLDFRKARPPSSE